jgi:hypothetical protein
VDRTRRIGLGPSEARDSRQRGCTCGQVEDLSTGKIHRDASTNPRHVPLATLGLSYTTSLGAWRVRCCHLARLGQLVVADTAAFEA